ncbi:MAG TPA: hypothetical protein VIV40_25545 [Kofleriaceae bacterium]
MGRRSVVLWLAVVSAFASNAGAGGGAQTSITVFATPPATISPYGGLSYGGYAAPSGAMITERRELDITSGAEVRISGIASTVDPATVQLRSLTEPGGVTVSEQRFVPGATTPDEILARHVGDTVSIVTPKGDVTGVLRSIDAQTLVLEVGTGDQRRLQMMRRDGYVQDIKLPAGKQVDKPSLVWRLATKKPGKHTVEVTYRADGLAWSADYLAIYDETAKTIDFSAWATLRNATGTSFDGAELTLVSGGNAGPSAVTVNPYPYYGQAPARQSAPPVRFTVPTPIHVGNGESVQVELMPPKIGAKARSVVTYDPVPSAEQMAISYQGFPATDCTMLSQTAPGSGQAQVAVEVDIPGAKQLPDGRVRVFKRSAKAPDRLEVLSEDQLRATSGIARVRLATHTELTGERKTTCTVDERARTLTEKVEVKVENKGKQAIDTVVREVLWRYSVWRIDPADENIKGTRGGPQVQEYRVNVPAGGKKSVTYTVVYQW